jgi:methylmalonyl-CoA mutase
MEIAKFRAFRLLWSRVLAAFGDANLAGAATAHARTARFDKTALDPHVNMLRATTETLSAVLGGVDSVQVGAFDEVLASSDDFSRRIARNIALMLAEEFNFSEVVDAAGGSWLVEKVSDDLARKSWALFQEIEKKGGFVVGLTSGEIQKLLAAAGAEKRKQVDTRRLAILGTNLFPNLREKPNPAPVVHSSTALPGGAPEVLKLTGRDWAGRLAKAVVAAEKGAPLDALSEALVPAVEGATVKPVQIWRAAEGFEALRAIADRYAAASGQRPRVFLAKFGPVKQHKPRADFSAGFFAVGGFEAVGKEAFTVPEAAAEAAVKSGAPVIVLCSTDETYPALVPPFAAAVKAAQPGAIIVLAGLPAEPATVAAFKQAGVDEFIHVRANVREILSQLLARIGAK